MMAFVRWFGWWREVPIPAIPLIMLVSTMSHFGGPMWPPAVFLGDLLGRLSPISSPANFEPKWSATSQAALWVICLLPVAVVVALVWWLASLL